MFAKFLDYLKIENFKVGYTSRFSLRGQKTNSRIIRRTNPNRRRLEIGERRLAICQRWREFSRIFPDVSRRCDGSELNAATRYAYEI